MTGFEAKAQCPTGFTFKPITLTVQDCDYHIQICYQCNATNNSMTVMVISFVLDNSLCVQNPPITPSAVLDDIYAQLNDPDYIEQLCAFDFPPCFGPGSGIITFSGKRPTCWRKYNDYGDILYEVCPDSEDVYCLMDFSWCYDADTQSYLKLLIGATQYGEWEDECPSNDEDDPEEGEFSDCFHIFTSCDEQL